METSAHLSVAALDQAGDAIIVIDTDGIVREWNQHSVRLFGFTRNQAVGQNVSFMIPERLRAPHDAGFGAAMAADHLASDGAARRTKALTADGGTVYVTMTFAVITDDHGRAIGSVAVAREWVREG